MANKYCSLLTTLSQKLSRDDIESLVFSCGDILPPAVANKITNAADLLRELKQRDQLRPTNYDYLREKLELVGRNDLAVLLPDQVEVYFGQPVPNLQRKTFLGFVDSPSASLLVPQDLQSLKFCPPNSAPRVFVMHLCDQLSSEDMKKLTFLMNLPLHNDRVTSLELAECFERKGGILSRSMIDNLIPCLKAIGRIDLSQLVTCITVPLAFTTSSLSTSHQQLNMKIGMMLHSKRQSYDLHMHMLAKLEVDKEFRAQLMVPVIKEVAKLFNHSNIVPLAKSLLRSLRTESKNSTDFDSLLRSSLLKISHLNKCYSMQVRLLESSNDIQSVSYNGVVSKCHEFYHSFDSLMDNIDWNPEARRELKRNIELQRTPFGSPGAHACQYILDLCQEVCNCDQLKQEVKIILGNIGSLRSLHYCCLYEVLASQWLATLVCLFTSTSDLSCDLSSTALDLGKHKDLLLTIVQQNKDDILRMYPHISAIIGNDTMEKLTPLLQSVGIQSIPQCHGVQSEKCYDGMILSWLTFNTFIMKLLAISTLDQSHTYDISFMSCDFSLLSTNLWKLTAAAMRRQVKVVRDKALAENQLCSSLITSLTDDELLNM